MPNEEDTLRLDTLIPTKGSDDSLSIVDEVRDTRGEEDTRALPHSTVIIAEDSEARLGQSASDIQERLTAEDRLITILRATSRDQDERRIRRLPRLR